MKAKHIQLIIKSRGNTEDIARAIIDVYNKDYKQVSELAESLRGYSVAETCKSIFDHVVTTIRYVEDPSGVQWVKTPARLSADKSGDCKSMAIFIASCLRCLDIPHKFRFVSFSPRRKEATHVYVVATDENGKEIIIDPVVRINGHPKFNYEEKYTYKSDMRGTDIYYMAGIRRKNAVGASNPETIQFVNNDERFVVWLGDSTADNMTPGKYNLFTKLDLLIEESVIAPTPREVANCYDAMDIISVLIHGYNRVGGDYSQFGNVALQVAGMIGEKMFVSNSVSLEFHRQLLPALYKEMVYRLENNYDADKIDKAWLKWIQENVVEQNHNPENISGFFDLFSRKKMANKLKESAMYFIYMFIPDNQVSKYKPEVQRKRSKQIRVFNWYAFIDVWHSKSSCRDLVRSGIIARTGKTPEAFIEYAKKNEVRIGEPITVITGIISIVMGLVKLIQSLRGNKSDDPTQNDIATSVANTQDELYIPPPPGNKQQSASFGGDVMKGIAPLFIGGMLLLSNMFKK